VSSANTSKGQLREAFGVNQVQTICEQFLSFSDTVLVESEVTVVAFHRLKLNTQEHQVSCVPLGFKWNL